MCESFMVLTAPDYTECRPVFPLPSYMYSAKCNIASSQISTHEKLTNSRVILIGKLHHNLKQWYDAYGPVTRFLWLKKNSLKV